LPFFVTAGGEVGNPVAATANVNKLWGFLLPYNVITTAVTYDVTTSDNTSNSYDIGLFSNSGSLVLDLGAKPGTMFAPSTGFKTLNWAQGPTSLSAARYYIGFTSNCPATCAKHPGWP
jgi:hypothetical protein